MSEIKQCPVCKTDASFVHNSGGVWRIACPRCGNFSIGWQARPPSEHFNSSQIANLSGWIRENQDCVLSVQNLAALAILRTPSVAEKAKKLLLYLSKQNPKVSGIINIFVESFEGPINGTLSYWDSETLGKCVKSELLSRAWAEDFEELAFLLESYLENELGYLQVPKKRGHGYFQITSKGWNYIDSQGQANPQSYIGFIAMWFDQSVDPMPIEAAIRSAGYEPLRIDRKEHNNKIDDEIIAGIRSSKFLVADFTGHRGGVYFEAGFAIGLRLPVIWLCRRDELEKAHFDTRQYNFILWETDKPTELAKALQNRIEATIGRGPLKANSLT